MNRIGNPVRMVRTSFRQLRRMDRKIVLMKMAVVKNDLITATAALSGLASILFGFFTNLPVALA